MPTPDSIRKDGPFTQRGTAYELHVKLAHVLLLDIGMRTGLSIGQAVAAALHDIEHAKPKVSRLTQSEFDSAVSTGIRNYHRWRPNIPECDEETVTRMNFATLGMKVNEVTFRSWDGVDAAADVVLVKPKPRGRPRKRKIS